MTGGLDDVIAAETVLSRVDGENGTLVVRGRAIEEIVASCRFEDMAALLWEPMSEALGDPGAVRAGLASARIRMAERVPEILSTTDGYQPIDALRAGLALVPCSDPAQECLDTTAMLAVLLAALQRRARGQAWIAPNSGLSHVEDLARMSLGRAEPVLERALETYLVTVADHGMNASTFTARVIASTRSDMVSAVTGALGALKGPLHGGAPGPVLDMLDEITDPAGIAPWIERRLASGGRLMGFGHRIYRRRDPRADILKEALRGLGGRTDNRIDFAETVEATARETLARLHPGRRLDTNVEFHTALLLDAVGIGRAFFTPLFAAGRVLGWTAHALEQQRDGRLIRPLSRYTGPLPAGEEYRLAVNG